MQEGHFNFLLSFVSLEWITCSSCKKRDLSEPFPLFGMWVTRTWEARGDGRKIEEQWELRQKWLPWTSSSQKEGSKEGKRKLNKIHSPLNLHSLLSQESRRPSSHCIPDSLTSPDYFFMASNGVHKRKQESFKNRYEKRMEGDATVLEIISVMTGNHRVMLLLTQDLSSSSWIWEKKEKLF